MAFPSGWKHHISIVIDHTKIDADLTDWTLVFDQSFLSELTQVNGPLDADGMRASLNGGGDIRFSYDAAGTTRLACDIRTWVTNNTPGNALCEVAVKISSVSSSSNTTIYMWWGKAGETQPAVSDTYGQYNAYDTNHVLVYAGNDGATGYNRCSSSYSIPDESGGTEVTGQIGKAQSFAGSTSQTYDTPGDVTQIVPQQSFTVEAMVKIDDTGVDHDVVLKGTAHGIEIPFLLWRDKTVGSGPGVGRTNTISFFVNRTGSVAGNNWVSAPSDSWNDTDWHHAAGRYTASSRVSVFINGSETANTSIVDPTLVPSNDSNDVRWGNGGTSTGSVDLAGDIDEMRLSVVSRSDAWMKANYNNLMKISGFLTSGSITDFPPPRAFGIVVG